MAMAVTLLIETFIYQRALTIPVSWNKPWACTVILWIKLGYLLATAELANLLRHELGVTMIDDVGSSVFLRAG
jgi:hypothetical protein